MSDHVLGEFPDLTPDHLRHTFVKPHNCPGLYRCIDHPKWRVWKDQTDKWWVTEPPGPGSSLHWQGHYSHAEALNHAQQAAAYQYWANNRTAEDEAFEKVAHARSIEVIKRSIADEQQASEGG